MDVPDFLVLKIRRFLLNLPTPVTPMTPTTRIRYTAHTEINGASSVLCRVGLAAALFLVLGVAPATAQLTVGDTIRVRHHSPSTTEGVLMGQDSSSLLVRSLGRSEISRVPRSDIDQMERLQGMHRRGWSAVFIGTAIGVGVGATIGLASGSEEQVGLFSSKKGCVFICSATDKAMVGGVLLGLVGTLGGTLAAFTNVPSWVPLPTQSITAQLAPVDGRLGVAMRWQP